VAVSSVELIINAAKALTALRQVDREGRKVQQVMGRAQGALYNLGEVGARATKRLSGGFKGAARNAKDLNNSLSNLRGGLARLGGAVAAKEIIETGVSAIESERKIKLLTAATGDTAEALNIAERAAAKFGLSQTEANIGVARLLARLKPMGMSLETIEETFVGFNTAARLAGATASESAGAFLQLTQALGSGVLRGQELNSILEQAPLIAQAIAQELNVTVGALKKLGEEGKILSPVVINALSRVGREGADQLTEALKGPGQQFRNLRNAAIEFSDTATQKLLPAILPVVNAATELLKGFVALPEPVKAVIVGTAALSIAFAALPPAILLIKGALVALKIAFLALPFVAAAAGLVAIGVAAAQANKKIKAFNDVVAITGDTTKELDREAEEVQKEIDKLAVSLKRGGHEGRIARKKLDKLNEALDKIQARKDLVIKLKIDVPFPDFDKMGPGFKEELNKLLGIETEEQKQARLKREEEAQRIAAASADRVSSLKEQALLASALTDEELKQFERQIQIANLLENKNGLTEKQLRAELEATLALHEQQDATEAIVKANEERTKSAEKAAEAEEKRLADLKKAQEEDPYFQMRQRFDELIELENQVAAGATAIGNAFSNAFTSVITGSKSAQEALADMMASVAEHFLDMAAKIIAQQLAMILYGTIMKALGVGLPTMSSGSPIDIMGADASTVGALGGIPTGYADGGYVSGPTNALVGEGGEPEYIIPQSKMRESMARYSRGARGGSVIPENGEGGTNGMGGGTAVAEPIDVRYTVERINSVDYVTADQFQAGMAQATQQGAKQGERLALRRLQQSSSARTRIGL